jgi:tRNA-splicing ligase RtcB
MAVEGYRLERIDDYRWRVPKTGPMLTDGLVFADDELIPHIKGDKCLQQVANVACLPGIQGPSIAMPDIHWGSRRAVWATTSTAACGCSAPISRPTSCGRG